MKTKVKTTAGVIIKKKNKILLIKRAVKLFRNKWCLPGGHIEANETAIQAAKREIKEETNLSLRNLKFFNYYDEHFPHLNHHAVVLIFTAKPIGKIKTNEEVSDYKWCNKKEALSLPLAFNHKKIIEQYFEQERKS